VRSLVQIQDGPVGGIAQLVERCLCKANVSGSSPLTSTKVLHSKTQIFKIKLFYVQEFKGLRRIPWHSEAKKDVVTDETLRGAGNKL
jgi:hypothetical protein